MAVRLSLRFITYISVLLQICALKEIKLWLQHVLRENQFTESAAFYTTFVILFFATVIVVILSVYILRLILYNFFKRIAVRTRRSWDDLLIKHRFPNALSLVAAVVVLRIAIPLVFEGMPKALGFFERLTDLFFLFVMVRIVITFLKATEESLASSQLFIEKPIASYFQLIRIIFYIVGFILALSILIGKSPLYFLSAFGAMTAILLLIFKDTILGLVASVQISSNDMVRIGDWVEMPKFNADGDVVAINLNTVKVSNWDKTITTVPTYYFVTESFKNWRGMQNSGGRRIKRTLRIAVSSVCFVDPDMREKFKQIDLIREYVTSRQAEIEKYNLENRVNTAVLINGRRMTNIGVFRTYVQTYLEQHPGIHQEMTLLVRQLTPDEFGVPLEIYCFTNTVKWAGYETIQSDIFDHLFASASYFGLQIFQNPSGKDFARLFENKVHNDNPGKHKT